MRVFLFAVALSVASAAGVLQVATSSAAQDAPRDVTYRAPLSTEGDVLLTFTPDLSGVTRAEVRDGLFQWAVPPDYQPASRRFSHRQYYDPPLAVSDGRFELTVVEQLYGEARESVRVDGTITGGSISGTATLVACVYPGGCFDLASAAWNDATVIATPPGPADTIHAGQIEGQNGTLTISTNPDVNVTSLTLAAVVAAGCLDPPLMLNLHMFFEPPVSPSGGIEELVVAGDFLRLSSSIEIGRGTISGVLTLSGVFAPDCAVQLPWIAADLTTATPEPNSTPPPIAPALPTSGAADDSGLSSIVPALASVGAALVGVGFAVARRRRVLDS